MKLQFLMLIVFFVLIATSCEENDPPMPDNNIVFSTNDIGIEEYETGKSFNLTIDRAESSDIKVVLGIASFGAVYGQHYTTNPAAVDGKLEIVFQAGQTAVPIAVNKVQGSLFDGDEAIVFEISSIEPNTILSSNNSTLRVSFSSIVSRSGQLTLNGGEGGAGAVNAVFVDFSNNEQVAVARNSWTLGFYNGSGFAVVLNNFNEVTAVEHAIALNTVLSASDSAALAGSLTLTTTAAALNLVDDWSGDLSKTVIQPGKVYVVNPGEGRGPLYKVMVTLKDANTYTLQYARSNESNVTTMEITKQNTHQFVYVSLPENRQVSFAPAKAKWDIVWGRAMYRTVMTGGITIPFRFSDLVLINAVAGVQVAEVVSVSPEVNIMSFNSMNRANADTLKFSNSVDAIGSKWRSGGGPNTAPMVRTDRFYVLKDPAGNIYKLQFVSLGDPRGFPQLRYVLL